MEAVYTLCPGLLKPDVSLVLRRQKAGVVLRPPGKEFKPETEGTN